MFLHKHLVVVLVLGAAVAMLGTGCSDKLQTERDSLWAQNQQLMAERDAARAQAAQERANALAAMDAARRQPTTTTAPSGLEGLQGVSTGKTAAGEEMIRLEGDVFFDSGKATLKPQFKKTLDTVAGVIEKQYAGRTLRVEGHTDPNPIHGAAWEDNWDLGAGRANAVRRYLESKGVATNSMYIASFADTQLRSAEDYAKDRRVDIVVVNR